MAVITTACLEGIARAFGEGDAGLTERDLEEICRVCGIQIEFSEEQTWRSLFDALMSRQFYDGDRRAILAFLRVAMDPSRYKVNPDASVTLREKLNEQLVLCNLRVDEDGSLKAADSGIVRPKIPAWDITVSSYAHTFLNFGLVIRVSWAPVLTGFLTVGFLSFLFTKGIGIDSDRFVNPLVLQQAVIVLFIPFTAIFLVAWHRFVLLKEKPAGYWYYFRLSNREVTFSFLALAFVFAMTSPLTATAYGYIQFMKHKAALGGVIDSRDVWLGVTLVQSWLIIIFPIFGRLLWVLPEIAIDKSFSLRRSWRLTRGNTWRLAMGLALSSIPWALIEIGIDNVSSFDRGGLELVVLELVKVLFLYFVAVFGVATVAGYLSLTYEFATRQEKAGGE